MSLIDDLFPGLAEISDEEIPISPEDSLPWSVLANVESGLQFRMKEFLSKEQDLIYIHPTAKIGEYVQIDGPCYVGPQAEVRHSAYLRKGSWISSGAIVGHATEVKNSIFLPGSKAPHFNYVGDSILGVDVNLGAGTKLSNVRNDRRGIMVTLEDGTRLDTGLYKLGAIIGDGSQLGCNVVTNPGTIIPPNSMVDPNKSVSGWLN